MRHLLRLGLVSTVGILLFLVFANASASTSIFAVPSSLEFSLAKGAIGGDVGSTSLSSALGARSATSPFIWIESLCLSLGGGSLTLSTLLCTSFKLLGVLLASWLCFSFADRGARPWGILGCLTVAAGTGLVWILRVPSVDNFGFLSAVVVVGSAYLVSRFGGWMLGPYVVVLSIALQTDISALPAILGISGALGAEFLLRGAAPGRAPSVRAWSPSFFLRGVLLAGTVVAMSILWLLPMRDGPAFGNILLSRLGELIQPHENSAGIRAAFEALFSFYVRFLPFDPHLVGFGTVATSLALISILAAALLTPLARLPSDQRWIFYGLGVAHLFYLAALARSAEPLSDYDLNSLLPVPLLFGGILMSRGANVMKKMKLSDQEGLLAVGVALLIAVGAGFGIAANFEQVRAAPPAPLEAS